MNRKYIGMLCLLLMGLLLGCESNIKVSEASGFIYCINGDGTALKKVDYTFQKMDGEQAVEEMLYALAAEPEDIDCKSAISQGVEVLSFELEDHQLKLNFNAAYTQLSSVDEVLCRAAVVQSLTEIAGVDYVAFYIEEAPLHNAQGNPVGLMKKEDFVKDTGSSVNSYQSASLNLYFANKTGDQLVKETVDVKYSSNISIEKLIVEQLLKGPTTEHAYPVMPKNTKLLGVSTRNGICYLNFDKEFLTASYDLKPVIPIYALVNSLVDGAKVKQVLISVNGETDVNYLDEVSLKNPFERNDNLVEGEEK